MTDKVGARRSPDRHPWRATDAANFVFERFIDQSTGATDSETAARQFADRADRPWSSSGEVRIRSSLARSMDRYADLFDRIFSEFASEMTERVTAAVSVAAPPAPVVLIGRPGAVAGAFVWIHNTSGLMVAGFSLRMTDLYRADGSRLHSLLGSVTPDTFDSSPQARRSAWVAVSVPESAAPGIYHGHLLADGLPDAAVVLRLVVE